MGKNPLSDVDAQIRRRLSGCAVARLHKDGRWTLTIPERRCCHPCGSSRKTMIPGAVVCPGWAKHLPTSAARHFFSQLPIFGLGRHCDGWIRIGICLYSCQVATRSRNSQQRTSNGGRHAQAAGAWWRCGCDQQDAYDTVDGTDESADLTPA